MAGNSKIKIKLQGHEKFALREGWLNKGLIMVEKNPAAFQGKDGPDIFGIGNNMVKSLRYWLKAFGLIEEVPGKGARLTKMGELILHNDPYFEDVFTIWLLHSYIAKNRDEATSWYMFFNKVGVQDLDKEQIERILLREITKYAAGVNFSEKSVGNDLDVILNMYGKTKELSDPEDKRNSPLSQLGLIKNIGGKYTKNHPNRKDVNELIILQELANLLEGKESIAIDDAINGENGLARIYQISTVTANEILDRLDALEYIRVNRTAGLDVIYKTKDFSEISVVEKYYSKAR
jgi:hypothetical protein